MCHTFCFSTGLPTGVSPAEMLIGRHPHSCLDLIVPEMCSKVEKKQQSQKY